MKRLIFTAGILSAVLLIGSPLAMQRFAVRKSLQRNKPGNESSGFDRTPDTRGSSVASENGEISRQVQELSFSHLRVKELERQAKGEVKEEDAVQAQERIFTDPESWRAFWSRYGEAPRVDFKMQHVAAVFSGAMPSPGYGIEIRKITYEPHKKLIVIHVVEFLPDPETGYADVIVYPSHVVVFPAKSGKVQFARTQRVRTKQA